MASQLSHCIEGLDKTCKACTTETETIAHYFWEYERVQRFWVLVSRFLQDNRSNQSGPAFRVGKIMVVNGFGKSRKLFPNADTLHGMAVWEIYRAHAELSMDDIHLTADAIFGRWKSSVMSRIVRDFHYLISHRKAILAFKDRWMRVPYQWFQFEPGKEVLIGTVRTLLKWLVWLENIYGEFSEV
ncbi:hypothetical protein BX661DRAFT_167999 [Kickxella alabastrina]|uniref:uncharacterized protein n=1 Tax=Kickxella alabastrina TaxID=61397 RepID=UPI002220C834|nr:uncharacterized protein BX661DRAFT_167999 [Kickxella alabastrina]KAI7834786.1 hypothetical protein BX661DRAFT_167999 [Kickxella alabastrina]